MQQKNTKDFCFFMPVQIFSGENCVHRHGAVLKDLGRRCLIITGGSSAQKSGALEDVLKLLNELDIEATVFPGITANPLLSQCEAAAYTAETCRSNFVIGIGGGSVMDAAKATAWLAGNNSAQTASLMEASLRRPPLPLILVGTTAGTGSEVSAVSVLTMDSTGRKKSVTHPNCYARYVFADPRYTHTAGREVTVSTSLDAFSHAVEGFLSPGCGNVAEGFGEKALSMISQGLLWLAENRDLPNEDMRAQLYYGSLWAGMVLNACGTAYPHPLGYILTEDFQLPHGMACAVFLPSLLSRAETFSPERAQKLFALCGGKEQLTFVLNTLITHTVTMTDEQIERYSQRWDNLKNFARTPGGFSKENAKDLFHSLFVK